MSKKSNKCTSALYVETLDAPPPPLSLCIFYYGDGDVRHIGLVRISSGNKNKQTNKQSKLLLLFQCVMCVCARALVSCAPPLRSRVIRGLNTCTHTKRQGKIKETRLSSSSSSQRLVRRYPFACVDGKQQQQTPQEERKENGKPCPSLGLFS